MLYNVKKGSSIFKICSKKLLNWENGKKLVRIQEMTEKKNRTKKLNRSTLKSEKLLRKIIEMKKIWERNVRIDKMAKKVVSF